MTNRARIIKSVILNTQPCPDGVAGIACPSCLAEQIAQALDALEDLGQ